ncbi:hypothetical protein GGQ62_002425 [Polymorphobacter fuscus]|uniref:DUF3035 domain-containing protein n=2 Tax=Sandarakinorhabdus fusca TaxID=1439888 RepID=A0A7C9GWM4_9SPHN|nr:DUF3035 domain-containing protein [Polymorphobacter fuscus]KAB7644835.1 DUF3035 domain-containing protein [Polymorphobacter fuscus]MQT18109.1 DUF3035 domain-containing protein [Polymorphobacter fuscus]NJC09427.1 hypothetical protein [Polymorphobacter fuscus]
MRNLVLVTAAGLALAACGKTGLASHNAPDELAISRNAPLVVPQDFALAPPKPGSARPVGQDAQSAAMEALFGPGVKPPPKSPAEQQLLDRAGAGNTDPAIRSNAADPKTTTVNKGAFVREILDAAPGNRNPALAEVVSKG